MKFLVVYEKTGTGYSAFIPDLPGCIATGGSLDEAQKRIREGAEFHVKAMVRDGEKIPDPNQVVPVEVPHASVGMIDVETGEPLEWKENKA